MKITRFVAIVFTAALLTILLIPAAVLFLAVGLCMEIPFFLLVVMDYAVGGQWKEWRWWMCL
jgi:hypothetical protein